MKFAVKTLLISLLWIALGCDEQDDTVPSMTIQSAAFGQENAIPTLYTVEGKSPPLSFSKPPEGTMSLALIMDNPDQLIANYTHWLVWNLPPYCVLNENIPKWELAKLEEKKSPPKYPIEGMVQGVADNDETIGYLPPAPPKNKTHRFVFTIYALDTRLKLQEGTRRESLEAAMDGHILAKGELVGRVTGN